MNPDTKLILDEINKRFAEHDLKWDRRFAEQETAFGRQIHDLEQAQETRVSALEKLAPSFDEWRPSIEGTVDDIHLQVKKLSIGWERQSVENPGDTFGVFASSPSVAQHPAADPPVAPPVVGPRVELHHRENGFGVVSTLIHSSVRGEHPPSHSHVPVPPITTHNVTHHHHMPGSAFPEFGNHEHSNSKIPKVDFPKFDGSHPKLWLHDCLDYFSLYHVEPSSWFRIARLHFVAAAKSWYLVQLG